MREYSTKHWTFLKQGGLPPRKISGFYRCIMVKNWVKLLRFH
jgi:hypothetical protein